ncbi:MAG TPA: ankyrin repeat domain-containing protein, partial [Candidatus Limnocylindria bacterium]|nr:ankyrin repeat domain-containing protein [Candidatus Limnocylindria bacterium]
MKKLIKYSLLMLLSSTGLAQGASTTTPLILSVSKDAAYSRLARLTGHVAVVPTTVIKKLAVAKTNASVEPQELTAEQQKQIEDVINGLVYEKTIFDCVEKNDLEGLKKLAQKPGFNVNVRDICTFTPLMCAASSDRLEIVQYLVSLKDAAGRFLVDVNAKAYNGLTALDYAYGRGLRIFKIAHCLLDARDSAGRYRVHLKANTCYERLLHYTSRRKWYQSYCKDVDKAEIVVCLDSIIDALTKREQRFQVRMRDRMHNLL